MKNYLDCFTEVLVRNNRTTTDGFITDTILASWFNEAHQWAAAYHKWPFTEARVQTTWAGTEELNFEGFKADSFRIVTVGGKRLQKLGYEDYLIMKEEEGGDDRVYSDFGRLMFVNPLADVSGTLVAYGQYMPLVMDITGAEATTTVFTDWDDEGNEAIVEKMTGYMKRREHLPQEAELHDQRAAAKLEEIWKRIQDEQALYQTAPERGGMFKYIDVLNGGVDNINSNQL